MSVSRIQELRKKSGYTQKFVADYLNCKRSAYSNWESWHIMLPLDVVSKLAILYDVSVSYILGYTDDDTKRISRPIDFNYLRNKLMENKLKYNLSYHQIGDIIGINKSTVQRYFTGKINIPQDHLILLCQLFELEIDDLCGTK